MMTLLYALIANQKRASPERIINDGTDAMDFIKALEISGRFQEAYETLYSLNGDSIKEKARPYIGMIQLVARRDKCSYAEAVLIILRNWHNSQAIPMSALTLWLLASAVILENEG